MILVPATLLEFLCLFTMAFFFVPLELRSLVFLTNVEITSNLYAFGALIFQVYTISFAVTYPQNCGGSGTVFTREHVLDRSARSEDRMPILYTEWRIYRPKKRGLMMPIVYGSSVHDAPRYLVFVSLRQARKFKRCIDGNLIVDGFKWSTHTVI